MIMFCKIYNFYPFAKENYTKQLSKFFLLFSTWPLIRFKIIKIMVIIFISYIIFEFINFSKDPVYVDQTAFD